MSCPGMRWRSTDGDSLPVRTPTSHCVRTSQFQGNHGASVKRNHIQMVRQAGNTFAKVTSVSWFPKVRHGQVSVAPLLLWTPSRSISWWQKKRSTDLQRTLKEREMSKIVAIMSMPLDGYVADPNEGAAEVNPTTIAGAGDRHARYSAHDATRDNG